MFQNGISNFIYTENICGSHSEITLGEDSSLNLTSIFFNYENTEDLEFYCNYTITAPEGRRVLVKFAGLDISYPDALFLGPYAFRGSQLPEDFISEDNQLEVLFVSSDSATRGFDLVISDYLEPGLYKLRKTSLFSSKDKTSFHKKVNYQTF